MNLEKIIEPIVKDMTDVNAEICKNLNSEIDLINQLSHYIINSGGKRIRPVITILIARALNYSGKNHIKIAALIELIHTATLLHDDVVDKSNIRRGKLTANLTFGDAASVLVGDFIYTRAFQMITELKSLKILTLISKAVNLIAEGEVLQLMYCNNPKITIENYMQVIYKKTARLFEVASQSSAILSGANLNHEIALRDYGRYLGTAFQLIDDLLDYKNTNEFLDKENGNDFNEGKLTLPLLHVIHNGNPIQVLLIRQAIKKGNCRFLLDIVLEEMYRCGSLEYTKKCANDEIHKAMICLKKLEPSPYRDALENLAILVVQRNF